LGDIPIAQLPIAQSQIWNRGGTVTETREIPRPEWNEFFTAFSQQHDAEVVALEVLGAEIGAQTEARELQLRGISPTSHQEDGLAVLLDSPDGTHLTHMITKPIHVWVQLAAGQSEDALEIESADGTKTLIRFSTPAMERDVEDGEVG
jgi:hypothetical protein